jgi:NAD(P)-dependent dehydrogenase (short-subunit alcohol dehydrogenase family)
MSLRGLVAIVTGASGGIGSATARALAAHGVNVALTDVAEIELRALASELQGSGVQALAVVADVTSRADIDRVVSTAQHAFGHVDVLANIAGVGASPSLCDSTDDELERVVAVNLLAAARTMHAVLPIMKAQGSGSIINVGSVAGEAGVMGIYSASKFGLRGLTDSVRREVRSFNIKVTLIEPGFVRTSFNADTNARLPNPQIVADAILASITHPRRRRIVPASYYLAVLLVKIFPGLTDLVFGDARVQSRLNQDARAMHSTAAANAAENRQ